jgi:hypothetical protein
MRVLDKSVVTQQDKFPDFFEDECSLPCQQEPATCPCPKPDYSIPHSNRCRVGVFIFRYLCNS